MKEEITISLCMIVRDEEQTIVRCLESLRDIVDEIVIVDTGSIDRTREIVRQFQAKVYDFQWIDNFAAARNFSFSKATKDYILWLDADDVFSIEDKEKFIVLKKGMNGDLDAVSMLYHLAMDSSGNPSFSSRRNRLVKREKEFKWIGRVHEYLEVHGNILKSDIAITHRKEKQSTNRNLKIYEATVEAGEELTPRDVFYYGNECVDHERYEEAIPLYIKFLEEGKGWKEDNIYACEKLGECYSKLKKWDRALQACVRSFQYDIPRGEVCTRLGNIFMEQGRYSEAIYWFRTATEVPLPTDAPFQNKASYTWVPYLQMCVCYSRLGDQEKGVYYNELAAKYVPDLPAITYNRRYFADILKNDCS